MAPRFVDADYIAAKIRSHKAINSEVHAKMVEEAPEVELAPVVHGRWVKDNLLPTHCSVCGELPLCHRSGEYERLSPYCPDCGAKMDLEASDG